MSTPNKAKEMARRAAREEGLLIGISSGAALAGVEQKLPELGDQAAHPHLQLRYRRALSLGPRLPAANRLKPPVTLFVRGAVNSRALQAPRSAANASPCASGGASMRRTLFGKSPQSKFIRPRARPCSEALLFDVRDHSESADLTLAERRLASWMFAPWLLLSGHLA